MKKKQTVPLITAVDLFCGAGGLTHGLRKSGIKVVAGYDIDQACAWPFERNNKGAKFHRADVSQLNGQQLRHHFEKSGGISLLAGCAPCQPFSTYSLNKTDENDQRWSMLEHFGRLIKESTPDLVTMENVAQLHRHDVFKNFVNDLEQRGYFTSSQVVKCAEYGIPQSRTRLVLIASRLGKVALRARDSRRDKLRTVKSAIGKLPKLEAGDISQLDPLHRCSGLSELNYKRILAAAPGGTWRDWEGDLVALCHQEPSGKTFSGVYGRMEWDKPSPTITTQFYGFGNGRFGHPEQNRALSLREGALLQTFPPKYEFFKRGGPVHITTVGRLIGNAVPVRLGQVIGESLLAHVQAVQEK